MADEGLAANPAPEANEPSAANSGAGSQALAESPEAPTPQATPAEAPQATPQAAPETWYSGLEDESLRGWVESKNYPDLETAIRQAYNLEKMRGVPAEQVLQLPRERTPENMREVFQKLGAPADQSEYQFPDGTTEDQATWFRKLAHDQGLTVDQAKATYEGIRDTINDAQSQAHEQFLVKSQAEFEELKQEKGAQFEDFVRDGRKARAKLEISDNEADALEQALGTKRFMQLLADVGAQEREAVFIDGDTGVTQFRAMSPAAAKAKLDSLKGDPEWNRRRLDGDKSVMDEYVNLLRISQAG